MASSVLLPAAAIGGGVITVFGLALTAMRGPERKQGATFANAYAPASAALVAGGAALFANRASMTGWTMALAAEALAWIPMLLIKRACDPTLWAPPPGLSLEGRVAVVTGGNCGMGFATARKLACMDATVVLACRSEARATPAVRAINDAAKAAGSKGSATFMQLDLNSLASVRAFATALLARHDRIDWLLNNAGAVTADGARTEEGLEAGFGSMHVGHFYLTKLLQERLYATGAKAGGDPSRVVRVINVASAGHKMGGFDASIYEGDGEGDLRGEKVRGGMPSYGRAKLANVLFTMELVRRWSTAYGGEAASRAALVTHTLHPGAVYTEVWRALPAFIRPLFNAVARVLMRSEETAAELLCGLLLDERAGRETGWYADTFLGSHPCRKLAHNAKLGARLWEVSERLVADFEAKHPAGAGGGGGAGSGR